MRERKPFWVERSNHIDLILTYLNFPELIDIFQNIVCKKPLLEGVMSKWELDTLKGHTTHFIIPSLEKSGVIEVAQHTPSGYTTEYTDLICPGMSNAQVAPILLDRAECIAKRYTHEDANEDSIAASCNFKAMSREKRIELFSRLRGILNEAMALPDDPDGEQFRLVLLGRVEK
jgi:hypothetical protein